MRGALGLAVSVAGLALFLLIINQGFTPVHNTGMNEQSQSSARVALSSMVTSLTLTSPVFDNNGSVPSKYTCDGEGVSPPLVIDGVPLPAARSLVLIVDDPDIPAVARESLGKNEFVHWVLFNIHPETKEIPGGGIVGKAGMNDAGNSGYAGPCPPKQYEPSEHRYFFTLYALDIELPLSEGASRADVAKAMVGHIVAETQLVGRYKRK